MAGPALPTNLDTTYADDSGDATVKTHQQHHDLVHGVVNQLDTVAVAAARGDILAADASGILGKVPAGTNGHVLTADSTVARGVKWATAGSGGASPMYINVKDHGAVGDGTADDTTAIQAALDAVPATGAVVQFPPGRYKVSATLTARNHATVIRGSLAGHAVNTTHNSAGTRLEASGTLSAGPMIRTQTNANTQPMFGCVLQDITLDGMGTATGSAVHWRSYRSRIENVHIYRFGAHGIHAQSYSGWDLYDSVMAFLQISECAGSGIYLDTGATDMHLLHSIIFANGVNFQTVAGSSFQVTGCHFYNGTTFNIWFNGGGSRSKFANCKIEGAQQHGVNIDSATNGVGYSDIQFTGCNITQNAEGANNTYDQFIIQGPSGTGIARTLIVGCSFSHMSGNLPRYGIHLAGGAAQGTVIVGNSLAASDHYGTAAIHDDGSASTPALIRANGGASPTSTTGTATITSAATSVTVTHGVDVSPQVLSARHVAVTPTNSLGSSTKYWVSAVTATTFTITVNAAPGATTATFAWQVNY